MKDYIDQMNYFKYIYAALALVLALASANKSVEQEAHLEVLSGPFLIESIEGISTSFSSELNNCAKLPYVFPPEPEACGKLSESSKGTYVVVQRGRCTFMAKAMNARNAGAKGLIILNTQNSFFHVKDDSEPRFRDFPVVMVSSSSGKILEKNLKTMEVHGEQHKVRIAGPNMCKRIDTLQDDLTEPLKSETRVRPETSLEDIQEPKSDMESEPTGRVELKKGDPSPLPVVREEKKESNQGNAHSMGTVHGTGDTSPQSSAEQRQSLETPPRGAALPTDIRYLRMLARAHGRTTSMVPEENEMSHSPSSAPEAARISSVPNTPKYSLGRRRMEVGVDVSGEPTTSSSASITGRGPGLGGRLIISWSPLGGLYARLEHLSEYLTLWAKHPTHDPTGLLHGEASMTRQVKEDVSIPVLLLNLRSGRQWKHVHEDVCAILVQPQSPARLLVLLSHMDYSMVNNYTSTMETSSTPAADAGIGGAIHGAGVGALMGQRLGGKGTRPTGRQDWAHLLRRLGCDGAGTSDVPRGLDALVAVPVIQSRVLVHRLQSHGGLHLTATAENDDAVYYAWEGASQLVRAAAGAAINVADSRHRRNIEATLRQKLHPDVSGGNLDRYDVVYRVLTHQHSPEGIEAYRQAAHF